VRSGESQWEASQDKKFVRSHLPNNQTKKDWIHSSSGRTPGEAPTSNPNPIKKTNITYSDLKIPCNPYQNINGILHKIRKVILKFA
jgi:hypothetical protein